LSGSPIAVVERDTGIGKDTLRVWERRYGFPRPVRDASGDRLYPADQIERLRLIRRLIDLGHRPGRLVGADEGDLVALAAETGAPAGPSPGERDGRGHADEIASRVIAGLVSHDVDDVRRALSTALMQDGLEQFVLDTVPSMNVAVGEAWGRGELMVFEEHLYTELLQTHLRQAIASLPAGTQPPRILLTTVPEEQHALGILMLEALYTMQGATCISLGTQTPIADTVAAVRAHRAEVVALSFSAAFPARQMVPVLSQLRDALPPRVALWAGGSGVQKLAAARRPAVPDVDFGVTLNDALGLLARWKQNSPRAAG
jgi:methanogenic corrinoid protein MtbC1